MTKYRRVFVVSSVVVSLMACTRSQLGLPRIALSVKSPASSTAALVRNHPELDPPNQSLHISTDGSSELIARLGPDQETCRQIAWAGDGSAVAFIVEGAGGRVVLVDFELQARASHPLRAGELPVHTVDYLSVQRGSAGVAYALCRRAGKCGEPIIRHVPGVTREGWTRDLR